MKFLRSIVRTACVALVCSTCISSVAAQDDGASSNAQPKPSPWRFYDDFSSKSLKKYKLTKKNGKSPSHPYDFVVIDGDIALSVTVESGLNSDLGGSGNLTERAEISVPGKNAIGREVWYGFRVLAPENFQYINDRVLISQFKNQIDEGKSPSPLVAIRMEGDSGMHLGGQHGGKGDKSLYNGALIKFPGQFSVGKINSQSPSKIIPQETALMRSGAENGFEVAKKIGPLVTSKRWTTYVVGAYTTKEDNGWTRIFQNGQEIYNYYGPTFDYDRKWPRYLETVIRIGIYRDSGAGKYPSQTLFFDDFAVASSMLEVQEMMSSSKRVAD
jgi:hypothetical protein